MSETQTRVRIVADHDPENPREWDCNLCRMVCWHRNYNLGDEQPKESSAEWLTALAIEVCPRLEEIIESWANSSWTWLHDECKLSYEETLQAISAHTDNLVSAVLDKHCVILPLYLYDHSGITISTTGFSCPWDSGQVGYASCSLQRARQHWSLQDDANWDTMVSYNKENVPLKEAARRGIVAEVKVYDQYITGDVYGFVVEVSEDGEYWEETDSCWGFFGSDPRKNGMAEYLDGEHLVQLAVDAEVEYPQYQ